MREYYEIVRGVKLTKEDIDSIIDSIDECKFYGGIDLTDVEVIGLSAYEKIDEEETKVYFDFSESAKISSWYDSDDMGRRSQTYYDLDWNTKTREYVCIDEMYRRIYFDKESIDLLFEALEEMMSEAFDPEDGYDDY